MKKLSIRGTEICHKTLFFNLVASDGLKLQGITPPGIAICQKLADSENICV